MKAASPGFKVRHRILLISLGPVFLSLAACQPGGDPPTPDIPEPQVPAGLVLASHGGSDLCANDDTTENHADFAKRTA